MPDKISLSQDDARNLAKEVAAYARSRCDAVAGGTATAESVGRILSTASGFLAQQEARSDDLRDALQLANQIAKAALAADVIVEAVIMGLTVKHGPAAVADELLPGLLARR